MSSLRMFAVLATLSTISAAAMGDPPATTTEEPADVLAGPRVHGNPTGRPTLVHREFDGRLKRLDTEPVGAAVALLRLSPDEQAATQRVLIDRKAALDGLIRENIPLVVRLEGAFKGQDGGQGQVALQELFEKARPILDKGVLIDQVSAVLPSSRVDELRSFYNEYMSAAVEDRMKTGEQKDKFGARIAEGFVNFQQEIKDSAARVFESGDKEFRELVVKLDLTPEQESKIQGMFIDLYTNSMGKPSKVDQAKVLLKSLGLLTEEQKVRLRKIIAEEARDAARAKKAAREASEK